MLFIGSQAASLIMHHILMDSLIRTYKSLGTYIGVLQNLSKVETSLLGIHACITLRPSRAVGSHMTAHSLKRLFVPATENVH